MKHESIVRRLVLHLVLAVAVMSAAIEEIILALTNNGV
jgi:hypothetical protein